MVKRFFSVFVSCCVLMCSVFCFSAAADTTISDDITTLNLFDSPFWWRLTFDTQTLYSRPSELSDSYQSSSGTFYSILDSQAPKFSENSIIDGVMDYANPGDTGYTLINGVSYSAASNGVQWYKHTSLYMYGTPLFLTGASCDWATNVGCFLFYNVQDSGSNSVFCASYSNQMLRRDVSYNVLITGYAAPNSIRFAPVSSSNFSWQEVGISFAQTDEGLRFVYRGILTPKIQLPVYNVKFNVTGLSAGDNFYLRSYAFSPVTYSYDDVLDQIEQNTADTEQAIKDAANQAQDNFDSTWEVGSGDVDDIGQAGQSGSSASDKVSALELADTISSGIFALFDADSLPAAEVTFPAFSIDVGDQSHDVWSDVSFDFSSLEENFSPLVNAVRFATVALCYFALIKYLHKVYEDIFMGSVGGSD